MKTNSSSTALTFSQPTARFRLEPKASKYTNSSSVATFPFKSTTVKTKQCLEIILQSKLVKAEVISSQLAPQNVYFLTGFLNTPPIFNWTCLQTVKSQVKCICAFHIVSKQL